MTFQQKTKPQMECFSDGLRKGEKKTGGINLQRLRKKKAAGKGGKRGIETMNSEQ